MSWVEKLPRPLLRWVCLLAAIWTLGLCDVLAMAQENTTRGIVLGFIGAIYGIRGFEKIKGAV